MEPQEIKGFHYYANSSFQNLLSLSPAETNTLSYANLSQNLESSSSFFHRSFPSNSPIYFSDHTLSPNTSPLSTDSTLFETSDHQLSLISHEKKLKRIISNRESARRSRIRKKRQIEELECQVNNLRTMNHQLSEKVIQLLENNQQILQENSQLKEKISSLQLVISDFLMPMRNVGCDNIRHRGG
ncbi:basic leucine zipper 43 [Mercurialis annua]|uniref:basic leucine zipper 43 n=1 Tax=Mercurialis annua TaxID=3986 RepID=UPI00215EF0E6|nr:basic leucine zipper 43 [Mercurialis annua]